MLGTLAVVEFVQSSTIYHYPAEAKVILNPLTSLTDTPSTESVKEAVNWLMSNNGLGNEFYRTIEGESNFVYWAYNPGGNSYGVAQFIPSTFKKNCKGDYKSTQDQLSCISEMFKKGQQYNWDVWCNIFGRENKQCKNRMGW